MIARFSENVTETYVSSRLKFLQVLNFFRSSSSSCLQFLGGRSPLDGRRLWHDHVLQRPLELYRIEIDLQDLNMSLFTVAVLIQNVRAAGVFNSLHTRSPLLNIKKGPTCRPGRGNAPISVRTSSLSLIEIVANKIKTVFF